MLTHGRGVRRADAAGGSDSCSRSAAGRACVTPLLSPLERSLRRLATGGQPHGQPNDGESSRDVFEDAGPRAVRPRRNPVAKSWHRAIFVARA